MAFLTNCDDAIRVALENQKLIVYRQIDSAIKDGFFTTTFQFPLHPELEKELLSAGYEIRGNIMSDIHRSTVVVWQRWTYKNRK